MDLGSGEQAALQTQFGENSMGLSARSDYGFGYGSQSNGCRWQSSRPDIGRFFQWLTHRLRRRRSRRALEQAHVQLKTLSQYALFVGNPAAQVPADISRDYVIVLANAVLGNLQARGIITLDERRRLAGEWVKDYVRGRLPELYRDKNGEAIDRLGQFLKAS